MAAQFFPGQSVMSKTVVMAERFILDLPTKSCMSIKLEDIAYKSKINQLIKVSALECRSFVPLVIRLVWR